MARTTAPLLSFGASGAIAKTQVYASWKGRPYARRYVIPANPKTADQTLTRNTFKWLNAIYPYMPSAAVEAWDMYAVSSRFTSRNGFIKQNLAALRSATVVTTMIISPSAGGGIPATAIAAAAGANQIAVTLTAPPLPAGWTIVEAIAVAIRQQNPQSATLYLVGSATDNTSPYVPTITGLITGQLYVVGGWFKYLKPDGTNAYGIALNTTATPT